MNIFTSTFDVSDVPRATEPLPEVPYHQAIESLLGGSQESRSKLQLDVIDALEGSGMNLAPYRDEIDALKADKGTRSIEACSRYHGRLLDDVHAHPVITALLCAFMEHRPLCLSPDMIWLLICQGVASHLSVHSERLRARFVQHAGKARIKVRRNDFIKGSPENPWGEVINEFSLRVREHIGSAHDLFVPRFSTTGPTEKIAAEIVLLDAMQGYFDYEVRTICGIPAITLEGTEEDWRQLADRAQQFADLELEWWLKPLQPLLHEFVAALRGEIRLGFWESIFKFESFSGGSAITGWIAAFFPYLNDAKGKPTRQNDWIAEGGDRLKRLLAGESRPEDFHRAGPSLGDFPSGLSSVPFVWEYIDRKFNMEFVAGFVGVAQDSGMLTLRPEIGWAIR